MFGNNMGGPFMVPNGISYGPMMNSVRMMGNPMMRNAGMMGNAMMRTGGAMGARGGLSSLLGLGRGASSLNIGNLLNGASKALGVVNQAIPIVKEVGPMMNNMRSMLKIASIFKDETDITNSAVKEVKEAKQTTRESTNKKENSTSDSTTIVKSNVNNEPNFFL